MQSRAETVEEYLTSLPDDRRAALATVRQTILANLPDGYEEQIQYGMIGYCVPHSIYPAGYRCNPREPLPFAALGNQKGHMALHLMCAYGDAEFAAWLSQAFAAAGKKLDMGKACLRFRKLDDLPLEVIGEAIARVPVQAYIERVEAAGRVVAERRRAR